MFLDFDVVPVYGVEEHTRFLSDTCAPVDDNDCQQHRHSSHSAEVNVVCRRHLYQFLELVEQFCQFLFLLFVCVFICLVFDQIVHLALI